MYIVEFCCKRFDETSGDGHIYNLVQEKLIPRFCIYISTDNSVIVINFSVCFYCFSTEKLPI